MIEEVAYAFELVELDEFPWRNHPDPWVHVVAETMLQRTRADQAVGPFRAVMARWPTPADLAGCDLDELAEVMRPLGLHNVRASRLRHVARLVAEGVRPFDLQLGTYTNRAVAVFAYAARVGMVDANVERVLTRAFGLRDPTARRLAELADLVAEPDGFPIARWYGALDVGRRYCKVGTPLCGDCPMNQVCKTGRKATR